MKGFLLIMKGLHKFLLGQFELLKIAVQNYKR